VEAFCLTPVIACLFFVAGVVYVGDTIKMQVILTGILEKKPQTHLHTSGQASFAHFGNKNEAKYLNKMNITQ
jgi:hypothetical protein